MFTSLWSFGSFFISSHVSTFVLGGSYVVNSELPSFRVTDQCTIIISAPVWDHSRHQRPSQYTTASCCCLPRLLSGCPVCFGERFPALLHIFCNKPSFFFLRIGLSSSASGSRYRTASTFSRTNYATGRRLAAEDRTSLSCGSRDSPTTPGNTVSTSRSTHSLGRRSTPPQQTVCWTFCDAHARASRRFVDQLCALRLRR